MPQTITMTGYTLAELKEHHPEGYKAAHARWVRISQDSGEVPRSDEMMDSARAVIKACGYTLADWSVGPWSYDNYFKIDGADDYDDARNVTREKDRAWFLREVLKPNGYTRANGHAYFPGNCAFTGVCYDDDYLEHVWKRLGKGDTLREALESLAGEVGEDVEEASEQDQSEETMEANWDHRLFTADGEPIKLPRE